MTPYFLRNLIPRREEGNPRSVFRAIVSLTPLQILQVFCGWFAWACDAIDFFTVVFSVTALEEAFDKSTETIVSSQDFIIGMLGKF